MKEKYKIICSFNLGKAHDKIAEMENSLNDTLSTCGVDDRFKIRSTFNIMLECERKLSKKETETMKKAIFESWRENKPEWDVKIVSFRRQSFSQSNSKSL